MAISPGITLRWIKTVWNKRRFLEKIAFYRYNLPLVGLVFR